MLGHMLWTHKQVLYETEYSNVFCLHKLTALLQFYPSLKVHLFNCFNIYLRYEHLLLYLNTQLKIVLITIIKLNTYILDPFLWLIWTLFIYLNIQLRWNQLLSLNINQFSFWIKVRRHVPWASFLYLLEIKSSNKIIIYYHF